MTAPPSRDDIAGTPSPSRATAKAAFGQLYDWLTELFAGGAATAAERAAARASLQATRALQPISASVAANALTLTLNPTSLEFRHATLSDGTVNTRTVAAAINLVITSGSTLGTTNGALARLAVLALDNAGTVELAVVNAEGGFHFDESRLVSTSAEGGAGAADSPSTIYSATARSNVPFRLVGYIDSTQTTAGTWASPLTKVQGAGGANGGSPAAVSMVRLHTANGNGSTNTAIRRFSTVIANVGSDISYADSATAGASFTINTGGVYAITYVDNFAAAADMGLSLDSTELTTNIGSIAAANRLVQATATAASNVMPAPWTGFLAAGAVIRPHTAVSPGGSVNARSSFTIVRVR